MSFFLLFVLLTYQGIMHLKTLFNLSRQFCRDGFFVILLSDFNRCLGTGLSMVGASGWCIVEEVKDK